MLVQIQPPLPKETKVLMSKSNYVYEYANDTHKHTHTHTQTHTQTHTTKKHYRWIGLVVGIFLGLGISSGYYKWAEKKATVHFQKNFGETKFQTELQKW
jgi:hypothetical protein